MAWKNLLDKVQVRALKLGQSDEYQRLLIQIQNLLLWIQDMRMQIESDDKPKYVHCLKHVLFFLCGLFNQPFHLLEVVLTKMYSFVSN